MAVITPIQRNKEGKKKPTRYYSTRQEKQVSKYLNAKRTKNSGATKFGGKGDVLIPRLMSIECKTKTKHSDSIVIKKEWFTKNKESTLIDGTQYEIISFSFGPDEENYYIIDEKLFIDFIEYLKNKEE